MAKIDHIGVVVKSIDAALKLYTDLLGARPLCEEVLEERGIKVCIIQLGETKIELLESIREESEISKYLEKKGEGLHHIAYKVEGISELISKADKLGLKPLSDKPKSGAHNTSVVFLHPKTTNGVLTELVEHK
jgi:methylmalonyl-CoA/ethylmalonyl-CoA epimerase